MSGKFLYFGFRAVATGDSEDNLVRIGKRALEAARQKEDSVQALTFNYVDHGTYVMLDVYLTEHILPLEGTGWFFDMPTTAFHLREAHVLDLQAWHEICSRAKGVNTSSFGWKIVESPAPSLPMIAPFMFSEAAV